MENAAFPGKDFLPTRDLVSTAAWAVGHPHLSTVGRFCQALCTEPAHLFARGGDKSWEDSTANDEQMVGGF